MKQEQHTLQQVVHFEGIGLHTGTNAKATCLPMPPNSGIQFQRTDLPNRPLVEALVTNVSATERGTVLRKGEAQVWSVEHLLAALVGLQIDNLCIQLDGPEVPNLDGSAQRFTELLLEAQVCPQGIPRKFFHLKEPFMYRDPETDSCFELYPSDNYSLQCTLAYDRWPLQHQYAALDRLDRFQEEIAAARTFVYLDEAIALYNKRLIQGGDPTKALIFSEKEPDAACLSTIAQATVKEIPPTIITPATHAMPTNEPARHKILDLMGDLALLGRPLQARIFAHKPGHGPNTRLAAALRKQLVTQEAKGAPHCNLHATPIFDVKQISNMLPHRYPFQLVDKIVQIDDTSITGVKNVTINEPFFQGHFPGNPIMPGVLQLEALAQTGGILFLHTLPDPEAYLTYFLSIDACKFRRMVVPGDTLLLHGQLLSDIRLRTTEKQTSGIAKIKGRVFVGEALACEAVLLAQIVKQHEPS
ncbi:MAG TPA: bifunctional UDP-3-O-[3-hydroxymyristoyl] N-acetylglucosamine deacetylase/3-hydroxyacyl-ACP dehydratase [Amoebophilaceae bacterium]|jgi:UDP-3-O-[3-hydroxymyristoyl] N-acetylglucosamine deacetylase/3-hydroxyacyl-[acyl-carrier-protein] dehydratase|nr:bifunctional UDP-3-O-[3-hydroxymyristoyl] N-acetylglucosamine deacetylase/3-hydroxyacyl-ACP dehydratase [Amoebophilaceae bacterium]